MYQQYVWNSKQLSTENKKQKQKQKGKQQLRIILKYVQTRNVFFSFCLLKKPINFIISYSLSRLLILTQPAFNCSKLALETLQQCLKPVLSK